MWRQLPILSHLARAVAGSEVEDLVSPPIDLHTKRNFLIDNMNQRRTEDCKENKRN